MKAVRRCWITLLSGVLFHISALPTLAQTPVAAPPSVVEERVPPASDQYALSPDSVAQPGVPVWPGNSHGFYVALT